MGSIYDAYNYAQDKYDKNQKKLAEFFKLLKEFKHLEYDDKIKLMKDTWGDITQNTTIDYTELCNIEISIDKDNKYHFKFNCKLIEYNNLKNLSPEIAEETYSLIKDDVQKFLEEKAAEEQETQKLSQNIKQLAEMNQVRINPNANKDTKESKKTDNNE